MVPEKQPFLCPTPPVLLIWPLSDIPKQRHGLRTNPTAAHHPVCPGPQLMPSLVHWQLGQHPSACLPTTGTPKAPNTLSPYFGIPWRTGSSSTTSCQTVMTTLDTSLQPWEPNPWRCMCNGCLWAAKRNRKRPKWKLLSSLTEIQQGMTHNVNTHVCLREVKDIVARPGEDPQDLITCIKTLMDHCKMVNDEHHKHKLCCHVVCAYCQEGKLLGKLMAKPFKTPSSELADIAVNHFAIQHIQEQLSHSTKPVDAICHDRHQAAHTSHNGSGHTPSATSRTAPTVHDST